MTNAPLTPGVDRDSAVLPDVFGERDPSVARSIESPIADAHTAGQPTGLCGQTPADDPAHAGFPVEAGTDSVFVVPDGFLAAGEKAAAAERRDTRTRCTHAAAPNVTREGFTAAGGKS